MEVSFTDTTGNVRVLMFLCFCLFYRWEWGVRGSLPNASFSLTMSPSVSRKLNDQSVYAPPYLPDTLFPSSS